MNCEGRFCTPKEEKSLEEQVDSRPPSQVNTDGLLLNGEAEGNAEFGAHLGVCFGINCDRLLKEEKNTTSF